MSQGERSQAPSKTICFAPEMPDWMRRLILELCPTPPADLDQVIKELQAYLKQLCQFQCECEQTAMDAAIARSRKPKPSSGDGYVRSRDLHEIYTQSRLRYRAWEVLDFCNALSLPPPPELCELYGHMDAPNGVYQFEHQEPWERRIALALAAEDILDGKKLDHSDLARSVGIPRPTLLNWIYKKVPNESPNLPKEKRNPIKDERWERDLADEIERRRARREKSLTR